MKHATDGRGPMGRMFGRSALGAVFALGVLGAASGCTELADPDDRAFRGPVNDADAATASVVDAAMPMTTTDPGWSCVLGSTSPPVYATPPKKVRYRVALVDFNQALLPSPPAIIACTDLDLDCISPVEAPVTAPPAKAAPVYQIELPFNFAGFLRISSPNFITTDYFFGGPVVGTPKDKKDEDGVPVVEGSALGIPSLLQLDQFYRGMVGGLVRDPALGVLAARIIDCMGNRAVGANMLLEPAADGAVAYTLENVPLFSKPPAGPGETRVRGVVGYVNLLPGNYRIKGVVPNNVAMARARSADLTRTYGNRTVAIRPGTLAVAEIRTDETSTLEGYTYAR